MSHTIAIVGAGFSGTVIAARLLREAGAGPLNVVLINRSRAASGLARGLAYGTQSESHLLNVPAGRMSAFPEDEGDFLRYLRETGMNAEGGSFVARRRYGEYLGETLQQAIIGRAADNQFSSRSGEVVRLERAATRSTLHFADGSTLAADCVVLALGNFAPADPPLADRSFFASSRYVRDPWAPGALDHVDPAKPVLMIGTGLTMFDVVLTLAARWPTMNSIAMSRRGLLPQPHRVATSAPAFDHAPSSIASDPATARAYLRAVRAEVAGMAAQGIDWREVVASLRPLTPLLWQRLSSVERARFLRHLRPYWESHRHRAAPEIAGSVGRLLEQKRLTIRAARILAMEEHQDGAQISIRPRGASAIETISAGTVINCTGPTSDFQIAGERLLMSLADDGQVQQDPLRLGIAVNGQLQICDREGRAHPDWYCVGPLLKSRDWEATAVPELRVHVRDAVTAIVKSIAGKP